MAVLLLFGACCRHFDHTVFLYAPDGNLCDCPSSSCQNVQDWPMWKNWNQQADWAKWAAIQMWTDFVNGI